MENILWAIRQMQNGEFWIWEKKEDTILHPSRTCPIIWMHRVGKKSKKCENALHFKHLEDKIQDHYSIVVIKLM